MITAMNIIILLTALVLAIVALGGLVMAFIVRNDGYGRLHSSPPRSHYPDYYDPTAGRARLF